MWKFFVACSIILSLVACANEQAPARVATVKPNVQRTPAKKIVNKPQLQTKYSKNTHVYKPKQNVAKSDQIQSNAKNLQIKPDSNSAKVNWGWPAQGTILKRFTASHTSLKGIEIGGSEGTPILAAGDGEVVYSGNSLRGYGNLIIIKHNKNFLTAYAHNRKNVVKEGDSVKLGQRIAEMGQTGTDRVKLHFEVRYQGKPIDPQGVLPTR